MLLSTIIEPRFSFGKLFYAGFLIGLLSLGACSEDIAVPRACFTINTQNDAGEFIPIDRVKVGKAVTFLSCSKDMNYLVIYTGDAGNAKAEYSAPGREIALAAGSYTYTYKAPGTYNVHFIATGFGKDKKVLRSEATQVITVDP